MRIAITGASGFLGRYLVAQLSGEGLACRCWRRPASDLSGIETPGGSVTWIPGTLGDPDASRALVEGCDAVVHAALERPGRGFRGSEGDVVDFVAKNVGGTLLLIEAARAAGVSRFVFISTCAVHEVILDDRPLDETHPLWPTSHYGAHKAAIEAFVHSYGFGHGYAICALRPTGIYGLAHPARDSKWFRLVEGIVRGEDVSCTRGGKEVHAADVARAVSLLLRAEGIEGQAYNCYDMYIAERDVADIARDISGSRSRIEGGRPEPKHQIDTRKIQSLGMRFGGRARLEATVRQLVEAVRRA